jgi:hypothetical protein
MREHNASDTDDMTDTAALAATFHKIVALVSTSDDLLSCWSAVLDITGQRADGFLAPQNVRADVAFVSAQLERIFSAAPLPKKVTYLYFALFDQIENGREMPGYYVAGYGGASADEELRDGREPLYWPANRYLRSTMLNRIKDEVLRQRASGAGSQQSRVLDYAITFAAAATISKFSVLNLAIKLPVYVGFDSGDFARIAN